MVKPLTGQCKWTYMSQLSSNIICTYMNLFIETKINHVKWTYDSIWEKHITKAGLVRSPELKAVEVKSIISKVPHN